MQHEHGELRGTLRVALPMSFGVRHMCKPIAAFTRKHPRIRFDLELNDRRVDLLDEGVDLAIRIGRLEDSSLIARKLFDVRAIVCAAPHYLNTHGTPQTPYELRDHAWFVAGVLDREPSIAICVLVEHGHHGSSAAAPLAKSIIQHFYSQVPGDVTVARVEDRR